jgi:hypothetical protein
MAAGLWRPEPLFGGLTVFLLGGGPSLTPCDVAAIAGRPTIAINTAGRLAPWAAVLFFRDLQFYWGAKALVDNWQGLAVTTLRAARQGELAGVPETVRIVEFTHTPDFPAPDTGKIRAGRSGGHLALSLAIAMGARRIVLLGYDCRFVDGPNGVRSHWHDDYATPNRLLYERDFLPSWNGWGAAAARAGVEVLNATPASAIAEFPRRMLAEVLA